MKKALPGLVDRDDCSFSLSNLGGDDLGFAAIIDGELGRGDVLLLPKDGADNPVARLERHEGSRVVSTINRLKRDGVSTDKSPVLESEGVGQDSNPRPRNRQRLASIDSQVGEGPVVNADGALEAEARSPSPTFSATAGVNLVDAAERGSNHLGSDSPSRGLEV